LTPPLWQGRSTLSYLSIGTSASICRHGSSTFSLFPSFLSVLFAGVLHCRNTVGPSFASSGAMRDAFFLLQCREEDLSFSRRPRLFPAVFYFPPAPEGSFCLLEGWNPRGEVLVVSFFPPSEESCFPGFFRQSDSPQFPFSRWRTAFRLRIFFSREGSDFFFPLRGYLPNPLLQTPSSLLLFPPVRVDVFPFSSRRVSPEKFAFFTGFPLCHFP